MLWWGVPKISIGRQQSSNGARTKLVRERRRKEGEREKERRKKKIGKRKSGFSPHGAIWESLRKREREERGLVRCGN